MAEKRNAQAYLDSIAEAEVGGPLAVSRNPKHRGAKMTKYGKTTAQLRVLRASVQRVFAMLKQVGGEKSVHIGKTTLQLKQHGGETILATRGL